MSRFDGVKNMLRTAIRRDAERRDGDNTFISSIVSEYELIFVSASMKAIHNMMSLGKNQI